MSGWRVPHDIYVHIAGIDIVRVDEMDFYVLEDNARTPSGVSYMLGGRAAEELRDLGDVARGLDTDQRAGRAGLDAGAAGYAFGAEEVHAAGGNF